VSQPPDLTDPPPAVAAAPDVIAVAFTQILRGVGLSVPTSCTHTFAAALCATGLEDRDTTYWAGRSTLVRRMEDIDLYDRAFAVFFDVLFVRRISWELLMPYLRTW